MLLFLFVVSLGLLIGFAMTRNIFGIVLITLIGFLTSFFSKNMIIILLISVGLTGVILGIYPVELRRIEGFSEDSDSEEEEESDEEEEEEERKPMTKKKKSDKLSLPDIDKVLGNSKKVSEDEDLSNDAVNKKMLDIYKETMTNLMEKTNSLDLNIGSMGMGVGPLSV